MPISLSPASAILVPITVPGHKCPWNEAVFLSILSKDESVFVLVFVSVKPMLLTPFMLIQGQNLMSSHCLTRKSHPHPSRLPEGEGVKLRDGNAPPYCYLIYGQLDLQSAS